MSQPGVPGERLTGRDYERLANKAALDVFPDYDESAMALCFNLIRIGNRVAKDLEISVHRPRGISFAGFRLLFAVRSVGAVNPNDLARLSSVSTASMSSLLNTMETNGLVSREPDPTDGRKALVRLTPAGDDLVADLIQQNSLRESAWAAGLTPTEGHILAELLRKLLAHHPGDIPADETPLD